MRGPTKRGIVLLANKANEYYDSTFFSKLYSQEGRGIFDVRVSILGYVQQGESPSPYDRKLGIHMSWQAMNWLLREDDEFKFSFGMSGMSSNPNLGANSFGVMDVTDLAAQAHFKNRIPKNSEWLSIYRPLLKP